MGKLVTAAKSKWSGQELEAKQKQNQCGNKCWTGRGFTMSNHLLGQLATWMYQCISPNYRKSGHEGKLTRIWITSEKTIVKAQAQNDRSPS